MMGEISRRSGGPAAPHVSHRTGRDVDIGYILTPGALGDRWWKRADEETFDVEKNWFLVKALLATGRVQQIFMSSKLQRMMVKLARRELPPERVAELFRVANHDYDVRTVITHSDGHVDHMHVRFRCPRGSRGCRARSRY